LKSPIVHAFRGKEHVGMDTRLMCTGFGSAFSSALCHARLRHPPDLGTDFRIASSIRWCGVRIAQVDVGRTNRRRAPVISAWWATFARLLKVFALVTMTRDAPISTGRLTLPQGPQRSR